MKLVIHPSPTAKTRCTQCKTDIKKGHLRADVHKYMAGIDYYHLACYTHTGLTPLNADKVTGKRVQEDRDKAVIREWVETWNRQFSAKEEEVPVQFLQKAVVTASTPLRRLLLEVFQYLTMPELETNVALSCKAWFHVSRDEEFWRSRVLSQFEPAETEAQGNYRRKYIAYWQGSCWHCKLVPSIDQICMKCPYFKRPLCTACASIPDLKIWSFRKYSREVLFSYGLLQELNVASFQYRKALSSYLYMIKEKVVPYVEAQKAKLVREIEAQGLAVETTLRLARDVENFNSDLYYDGNKQKSWKLRSTLAEFLGAKTTKQRWNGEVARLLQTLNR